jgi:hypothetical protein
MNLKEVLEFVEYERSKMKPTKFPEINCTFAKSQPQYLPLPAHRDQDGTVTSCWQARVWERLVFLFTGRLWIRQLTFGAKLQAQRPTVLKPELK